MNIQKLFSFSEKLKMQFNFLKSIENIGFRRRHIFLLISKILNFQYGIASSFTHFAITFLIFLLSIFPQFFLYFLYTENFTKYNFLLF